MKKNLYQERSTIWQTRKGSVEILMIFFSMIVFILIPFFIFLINILFNYTMTEYAKDCLEISSINTYSMIDFDSLGEGIIEMDPDESEKYFLENFKSLTMNDKHIADDADVSITISNANIRILSQVTVTGLDKGSVTVHSDVGFVIDPLLED